MTIAQYDRARDREKIERIRKTRELCRAKNSAWCKEKEPDGYVGEMRLVQQRTTHA